MIFLLENDHILNLENLNIQKILGRGEINKKVNVTVKKASKSALDKIKKASSIGFCISTYNIATITSLLN